jgi:hypothetical protein
MRIGAIPVHRTGESVAELVNQLLKKDIELLEMLS